MWKEKLKREWNEDPMKCLMVGSSVAVAATVVLNALSAASSRRAYARQINHKIRQNG